MSKDSLSNLFDKEADNIGDTYLNLNEGISSFQNLDVPMSNINDSSYKYKKKTISKSNKKNGIFSKRTHDKSFKGNPTKRRKIAKQNPDLTQKKIVRPSNFGELKEVVSNPKYFFDMKYEIEHSSIMIDNQIKKLMKSAKIIEKKLIPKVKSEFQPLFNPLTPTIKGIQMQTDSVFESLKGFGRMRKVQLEKNQTNTLKEIDDINEKILDLFNRADIYTSNVLDIEDEVFEIDNTKLPCFITHVNMEQGDCTLIRTPKGKTIMIDCGSNGSAAPHNGLNADNISYIKDVINSKYFLNGIKTIDYLILTHPDQDHFSKVISFLGNDIKVNRLFHSQKLSEYALEKGKTKTNFASWVKRSTYEQVRVFNKKLNGKHNSTFKSTGKNPFKNSEFGLSIQKDKSLLILSEPNNIKISILSSEVSKKDAKYKIPDSGTPRNQGSIVTLIETHGKKIIISGDATKTTESFLLEYYNKRIKNIDLITAGHHGSATSSSPNYIKHVNPKRVVISAGYGNVHGLPRISVLKTILRNSANRILPEQKHPIPYNTKPQRTTERPSLWNNIENHLFVTGILSKKKWRRYWVRPSGDKNRNVPVSFNELL